MDKKTAEKASKLLNVLERLNDIQEAMKEEKSHWWSIRTNRRGIGHAQIPN